MSKKIMLSLAIFLFIVGALAYRGRIIYFSSSKTKIPAGVTIAASFYPLVHFAEKVSGTSASVISMVPNGIEPHEFEPTPQDIIRLRQSKVFFYIGDGLEPWAERLKAELEPAGVRMISIAAAVTTLPIAEEEIIIAESEEEQAGYDPHVWLDPVRAQNIVALIRDELIQADPTHATEYRQNAANYTNELAKLHDAYEKGLAQCASRDIVVSHDAYQYVAHRYGLNLHAIAGLSPEAEPSPQRLAKLTERIKDKKISTVFFETLTTPKLAETLARETGAKTDVLNPIEGLTESEQRAGKNYDSIMQENLVALRRALVCQ